MWEIEKYIIMEYSTVKWNKVLYERYRNEHARMGTGGGEVGMRAFSLVSHMKSNQSTFGT